MTDQWVGSRGAYEYITSYDSPNYNGVRVATDAILVHHWGNKGQKFENVIAALSGAREASAQYVLEGKRVACIISPDFRAWHCGYNTYQKVLPGVTDVNSHTIGIECRPECTDEDVETLCQLIADLWMDYGKVPVYGHLDFMPTACPGDYYPKLDYIRGRAEEIYTAIKNGEDVPGTNVGNMGGDDDMGLTAEEIAWVKQMYANSKATAPADWAVLAVQQAVADGITDGQRPQDVATRQELFIIADRVLRQKEK